MSPVLQNSRMLKATLSDYLFQNFVNSWTDDVTRNNACQGTGRNKLRTYRTYKSVYLTEHYRIVLCPTVIEVRMLSFVVALRQFA